MFTGETVVKTLNSDVWAAVSLRVMLTLGDEDKMKRQDGTCLLEYRNSTQIKTAKLRWHLGVKLRLSSPQTDACVQVSCYYLRIKQQCVFCFL